MPITQSIDGGTLTLRFAGDFVVDRLAEIESRSCRRVERSGALDRLRREWQSDASTFPARG